MMQELNTLWSPAAGSGSSSPNPRHSRASRVWRAFLVLVWVVAVFLVPYQAQPVSAAEEVGIQEYYILGDEEDILAALQAIPRSGARGPIHSHLSIVAGADSVNIYLDEWEDGYDFDPSDPSTTADAREARDKGGVVTWDETDAFVPGSEGVDGGDRLYIKGLVSVVRIVWPDRPGPYLAGAWELYPSPAWKSFYVVPVGEDLDFPDSPDPFEYTFLFIEAAEDNTRVVVTDPTAGVLTDTVLSRGENIYLPDINAGTTVVATDSTGGGQAKNIQAGLITSVNGVYDSRYYTLTPEDLLCNEYYLPVPSMQFRTGEFGGRDINNAAYIYAFLDNTNVTIETSAGTQTVTLNRGEVYRYLMPRMPRGTIQGPYGARITSSATIWILVAGDDDDDDLDWGYQAMCGTTAPRADIPVLGNEYYLPFAPANPAHITPIDGDTTFFVDWDNDGVVDDTFVLDRFETRMLFDPDDEDATGAHIRADGRFAIAWGQDNTERTPGEWGLFGATDLDFGYTVLPLKPGMVDPVLKFEKTVDPTSLPCEGGAVQFTLVASTEAYPVYNVDISDTLPPGWGYLTGTTTIIFSDGTPTIYDDPAGAPGPDLLWALDKDLGPWQSITVTFGAETIPGAYLPGDHTNSGQACGEDEYGDTLCADDYVDVSIPSCPAIELAKTVYLGHDGGAGCPGVESVTGANGADVTYCFEVTNTGNTYLDEITIDDADLGIDETQMTWLRGSTPLAPGDSLVYYYEGTISGDLVNTAKTEGNPTDAEGNDLGLDNPTDEDDAAVYELGPAIELAKTVYLGHDGGAGCPGVELVTGAIGADVTYCFEVTNTGVTYLDQITIDDADLGITQDDMTLLRGSTPLAPGDSLVYYYEDTISGDLRNWAKTEGNPTDADGNDLEGLKNPTDEDDAAVLTSTPTPTPTPTQPKDEETRRPPPPTSTPTATPASPTPTVEVVTVARLPETGGFLCGSTVFLGVFLIIGAASLLNLALLEKRGRRGDGKGD